MEHPNRTWLNRKKKVPAATGVAIVVLVVVGCVNVVARRLVVVVVVVAVGVVNWRWWSVVRGQQWSVVVESW
jgi:hypothetical protein